MQIILRGISHGSAGSLSLECAVSDDGTNFSTSIAWSATFAGSVFPDALIMVYGAGLADTSKLMVGYGGSTNAADTAVIGGMLAQSRQGVTTHVRFDQSGVANWDAGTYEIWGIP